MTPEESMKWSKLMTLVWGVFCIILAFSAGNIADTVIEAINKVGSAFYGPIVATFLLAILGKKTHTLSANLGLLVGVGVNVFIWLAGIPIFWIWWNMIGAAITFLVAAVCNQVIKREGKVYDLLEGYQLTFIRRETLILVGFFILMLLFTLNLGSIIG